MGWRRIFVRAVAVVACVAALGGIVATVYAYRQLDSAERAAREQLRQFGDAVGQVAAALRTVSASAGGAAGTVDDADASLVSAAAATRGTAGTLDETATALRPNLPEAAASFRNQALALRELADRLEQTGGSLERNAADLRAIEADVAGIARDLEAVANQLRQFARPERGGLARLVDDTRLLVVGGVVALLVLLLGLSISLYLVTSDAWYDTRRNANAG